MYLYVTPRYHIQILSLGEYVKKHKMSAIFWHLEIHEQTLTERLQNPYVLDLQVFDLFIATIKEYQHNTNTIQTGECHNAKLN